MMGVMVTQKLTESHREVLRLVGLDGGYYWDVFNDWQVRRGIPCWLLRPSATFSKMERMGLLVLDGEMLCLTELGRKALIS